jgi:transcription antitermination factor NusG
MQNVQLFKDWFVLYTRPNFEKKISREIDRLNYENYLPLRMTFRKWSDRVKRIEEPLFPNYLFVRMAASEKHNILSAEGAVRLVSFEGKPVPVKESEIAKIRKLESVGKEIMLEGQGCAGDKVRVIRGILAGYEGELLRKSKASRLLIKLAVLNQGVSVEISDRDVELIA